MNYESKENVFIAVVWPFSLHKGTGRMGRPERKRREKILFVFSSRQETKRKENEVLLRNDFQAKERGFSNEKP
jgi:hypothetical protein